MWMKTRFKSSVRCGSCISVILLAGFAMAPLQAQNENRPDDLAPVVSITGADLPNADDASLLAQLMAADARAREDAMRWLMIQPTDDVEPLFQMARVLTTRAPTETTGFEAEGLARLRQVARHRLIRSIMRNYLDGNAVEEESGAMGVATSPVSTLFAGGVGNAGSIRFEAKRGEDAIIILGPGEGRGLSVGRAEEGLLVYRTVPGMPAHAVLRVGDRLLGIDEQWIPANTSTIWLSNMVTRSSRGHTLILRVDRDGQRLDLPIVLTGSRALAEISEQTGGSIREPYRSQIRDLETRFDQLLAAPRRLPAASQIVQP